MTTAIRVYNAVEKDRGEAHGEVLRRFPAR